MKKNMGNTDKIIRIIVALILVGLYFGGVIEGTLAYVLLAISGIFVITSFINFCPLYAILGISTKPKDK